MDNKVDSLTSRAKITKLSFLWMSLSQEPFVALYALLPFILAKDLKASALEISFFVAIRPISSLFSYYWHAFTKNWHPNLRKHLRVAWALSFIPFLIYPPLNNIGYVMIAATLYQLFSKAAMPPFFEIFKQNLDPVQRKKLISNTYLASFLISALLGLFFGQLLDKTPYSWRYAASIFAAIALTSLVIQQKLMYDDKPIQNDPESKGNYLFGPLKESLNILKSSKEFKNFQIGFMIGGSALMFIGPALTIFYADSLEISHKSFTQARYIFMSIGILCSTPFWKKAFKQVSINQLMPYVSLFFGIFPLVVITSYLHTPIINSAFMIYGIAQAGSHLIWNLSPSIFSKEQDSAPYTALNILMQGIRGLFAPVLGGIFTSIFGPVLVLILGSLIAFYGVYVMMKNNKNTTIP